MSEFQTQICKTGVESPYLGAYQNLNQQYKKFDVPILGTGTIKTIIFCVCLFLNGTILPVYVVYDLSSHIDLDYQRLLARLINPGKAAVFRNIAFVFTKNLPRDQTNDSRKRRLGFSYWTYEV